MDAKTFLSLLEVEKVGDCYRATLQGETFFAEAETAKEAIAILREAYKDKRIALR